MFNLPLTGQIDDKIIVTESIQELYDLIDEGLADVAAGRTIPFEDVINDLKKRFGDDFGDDIL